MAKNDCSVTVNFFKEKERMCNSYRESFCSDCPMKKEMGVMSGICFHGISNHPEDAVKIVQEWSDEHPVKTRLEDLLEKYPKYCILGNDNCPGARPCVFGYCVDCKKCRLLECTTESCWNEPVDGGATGKAVG